MSSTNIAPMATPSILDLNNDVLYHICRVIDRCDVQAQKGKTERDRPPSQLLQWAATCKRMRSLAAPLIYRKSTLIDQVVLSTSDRASSWLLQMESTARYTRHLTSIKFIKRFLEEPEIARLAKILTQYPNLKSLHLVMLSSCAREIAIPSLHKHIYPQIRSFTTNSQLLPLVPQFPNLTALRIDMRTIDISIVRREAHRHARDGHLRPQPNSPPVPDSSSWDGIWMAEMAPWLKRLRHLAFVQDIEVLHPLVWALAIFPALEVVGAVQLHRMVYGHAPIQPCEPCGDVEPRRFCEHRRRNMVAVIGKIIFAAYPILRTVEFGVEGRLECLRTQDGGIAQIEWRTEDSVLPLVS